jgi:23S rRNA pseudouridine2604 synthase
MAKPKEDENMEAVEIEFPIRINRYLFLKGYCSRRQADKMISAGEVMINGVPAELGTKVKEHDKVEVSKRVQELPKNYEYYLFNKPQGVVSHNPQHGEKSVEDFFPNSETKKLAPVGRLDKDSTGLMFITNDGRIIDKMLNPRYDHEKEYYVKVDKPLKESFARKMSSGVDIEGYTTKPAKVEASGNRSFTITLTEGKKHQIRRMCAALGYQVRDLRRKRIMHLTLDGIRPGQFRPLTIEEKIHLLKYLGLR